MIARIVLAVDNRQLQTRLSDALAGPGVFVQALRGRSRLWERAVRESCDLFVVARALIEGEVADTVRLLRGLPDSPDVVVLSRDDAAERARLFAAGCSAVLDERLPVDAVRDALHALLDKRLEVAQRPPAFGRDMARPRLTDFVSSSPAMQTFMRMVSRVVDSGATLLFQGETGVGKERLARAIHAEGPQGHGPFVTVNCGALPEALLESELFGHVEGAFTGATRSRRGMFELAHGGTIFLDEIGEMPYHLQVKLLQALQQHEIQPVGAERTIPVDVRVMAATNRDLAGEVDARQFRRDLYYRLSVVALEIPPLRERREDIAELVESYLDHFANLVGREVDGIADSALAALRDYDWPGNVRELINVIERAMLLCEDDEITLDDLPAGIGGRVAADFPGTATFDPDRVPREWLDRPWADVRRDVLAAAEGAYLAALLHETGGRIGETASRAGFDPRSLYDKMKAHGLRKEDYRPS